MSGRHATRLRITSRALQAMMCSSTGEALKSRINAGREGGVFKAPDYVGVFLPGDITQVPARFEIAKRSERHDLASRR